MENKKIATYNNVVSLESKIPGMKKLIYLGMLLMSVSATQAQLLWKVSGNGLKHPSYLFGTHHLIPISYLDSVSGLYKAFNSCQTVIGEMVMSNVDAISKIKMAAIMPNHINMTNLLSESEYKLVDNELTLTLKLGLKEVGILNPALIVELYKMEIYKKYSGYKDDVQSDSYFQLVATENDKNVIGLETVDQQIAIMFGDESLERNADILIESIINKDSLLTEMIYLDKLYKSGEIEKMIIYAKGNGKPSDMTANEYHKLIDNRNSEWIKKLPDYFKQNSCFVAVGALHLGGENGVIRQLQTAGYKVKPVE